MAATVRLQLEPDIVDMDREMRAQERAGPQLWLLTTYLSYLLFCLPEALNELLPDEVEGITKEEDDAIMRAKQRQVMVMVETLMMMMIVVTLQMFLDDVGVTIAMITVTLLAVVVVVLKVLLFSDKVHTASSDSQSDIEPSHRCSWTRVCPRSRRWSSRWSRISGTWARGLSHVTGRLWIWWVY